MSFQATEWARSLPLDSLSAKFTLLMIASYAGTDDSCFPSLAKLADDTLQSVPTVRRRIREIEELGLLVRMARWTSPDGQVIVSQVGDGARPAKCRQTSDELRLLLHVTPEQVKTRVAAMRNDAGISSGETPVENDGTTGVEVEGEGVNLGGGEGVNLQPPGYHPGETPGVSPGSHPLNSNSNIQANKPPNPPSGGGQAVDQDLEADVTEFAKRYPAPITNLPRLRLLLGAMDRPTRQRVLVAALGYAKYIEDMEKRRKPRAVKDADRWVAAGMWEGYVAAGTEVEQVKGTRLVPVESEEGKAWAVLHDIAHLKPLGFNGKYLLLQPLSPQGLTCATAPPVADWVFIPAVEVQQAGAWNAFLSRELAGKSRPVLAWDRNPGGALGFHAPWPWPPRKDGMTYKPPRRSELMTAEDEEELQKL